MGIKYDPVEIAGDANVNLGVPLRKMTLIKNIKGLKPFSQFLIHINTESLLVNCFE